MQERAVLLWRYNADPIVIIFYLFLPDTTVRRVHRIYCCKSSTQHQSGHHLGVGAVP